MKRALLLVCALVLFGVTAQAQERMCKPPLYCAFLGAIDPDCWCHWGDQWRRPGPPPMWWGERHRYRGPWHSPRRWDRREAPGGMWRQERRDWPRHHDRSGGRDRGGQDHRR